MVILIFIPIIIKLDVRKPHRNVPMKYLRERLRDYLCQKLTNNYSNSAKYLQQQKRTQIFLIESILTFFDDLMKWKHREESKRERERERERKREREKDKDRHSEREIGRDRERQEIH